MLTKPKFVIYSVLFYINILAYSCTVAILKAKSSSDIDNFFIHLWALSQYITLFLYISQIALFMKNIWINANKYEKIFGILLILLIIFTFFLGFYLSVLNFWNSIFI